MLFDIQKTTLLDYPGKIAALLYWQGCNFRCPFCHNKDLICFDQKIQPRITPDEVLAFLNQRIGKLQAVCITGGEPTLDPNLIPFISAIKKLGYLVKLDTNGSNPTMLAQLFELKLIDYIAMDIKNAPASYSKTINAPFSISDIEKSIALIIHSAIPYEFRTTFVSELHTPMDIDQMVVWLKACQHFVVQSYTYSPNQLGVRLTPFTTTELDQIKSKFSQVIPQVTGRY